MLKEMYVDFFMILLPQQNHVSFPDSYPLCHHFPHLRIHRLRLDVRLQLPCVHCRDLSRLQAAAAFHRGGYFQPASSQRFFHCRAQWHQTHSLRYVNHWDTYCCLRLCLRNFPMYLDIVKASRLNLPDLLYSGRYDNRNPFDGSIKGGHNLLCPFDGYISLALWKK